MDTGGQVLHGHYAVSSPWGRQDDHDPSREAVTTMRSKAVVILGALGSAVLSLVVVVGVAQQWWVLAAAAGCALVSAAIITSLDTARRTRALRSYIRNEIKRASPKVAPASTTAPVPVAPPPVTPVDVVGTVRMLQAQYVGRLDRLHASVEALLDSRDRAQPDRAMSDEPEVDEHP